MRQGSHAFVTSRASTLFHAHQPRERLENFTAKRKSRLGSSPGALISGFDVDYGLRLSRAFKSPRDIKRIEREREKEKEEERKKERRR